MVSQICPRDINLIQILQGCDILREIRLAQPSPGTSPPYPDDFLEADFLQEWGHTVQHADDETHHDSEERSVLAAGDHGYVGCEAVDAVEVEHVGDEG